MKTMLLDYAATQRMTAVKLREFDSATTNAEIEKRLAEVRRNAQDAAVEYRLELA